MKKVIKEMDRRLLAIIILGFIVITLFVIVKLFGNTFVELFRLLKSGDETQLEAYFDSQSTLGGYLALYLICILQVVSIFIPGMVIQISGSLIYGWFRSFLVCWMGFVSGNGLVFSVARIFGKGFAKTIGSENKSNWLVEKINGAHPALAVAIGCMVPGVPNGIIPYVASTTNISLKSYVLAVLGSSWVQILLNCIIGHFLVNGEWGYMLISVAIEITIICLLLKNRNKFI